MRYFLVLLATVASVALPSVAQAVDFEGDSSWQGAGAAPTGNITVQFWRDGAEPISMDLLDNGGQWSAGATQPWDDYTHVEFGGNWYAIDDGGAYDTLGVGVPGYFLIEFTEAGVSYLALLDPDQWYEGPYWHQVNPSTVSNPIPAPGGGGALPFLLALASWRRYARRSRTSSARC